jgi:ureidoglycolate hydrolase
MQTPLCVSVTELRQESFEPFGRILNPQAGETPSQLEKGVFDFYVPFAEPSSGWQIGFLEYTGRRLLQLERHPNTPEVFAPLKGEALLVLALDPGKESDIRAFRLEKPIVLNRGVWHGVIALSPKAEILIVENPDVVDEFHELRRPIEGERR